MKIKLLLVSFFIGVMILSFSFKDGHDHSVYELVYKAKVDTFTKQQLRLLEIVDKCNLNSAKDIEFIKAEIQKARNDMKGVDFWFRYMEPLSYKKINGPLPVEWEIEVFEKFEKPYKREGAGFTLAALYLDEPNILKDSLTSMIKSSVNATKIYLEDSITGQLRSYHHFYLCNRLFLLNLAAIYTTGFENPDTAQIIPELRILLAAVGENYRLFNETFPATPVSDSYLSLYNSAITFVNAQSTNYTKFDHFSFIRDYVNPLFTLNQAFIKQYKVVTRSLVDYTLNKNALSIFDKSVYNGQNTRGIFIRVNDTAALAEIDRLGKLLFYDPILSGNNMRSCASCHKPEQYFTDTSIATSPQFDGKLMLERNTPSLINVGYNHLIMLDGNHYTLQNQTKAVMTNPIEMGSNADEILKKVLSCKEYKAGFSHLLKYTPQEPEITIEHLSSAITFYYGKFAKYNSPFDDAMNGLEKLDNTSKQGFNLFMSKAQCGTCHFVPQFNGVKPPFVSSEFEVLGVPADTSFKKLSSDKGRFNVNPAQETMNAFRTGSIRNAAHTMPYMHNGVFRTMDQVVEFYNNGGGAGRGLKLDNQTLSADSLRLNRIEKKQLISFINSLNEHIVFERPPFQLPVSKMKALNKRKVGGIY